MAKYLVTGGAGFIGSHLTRRLVEDGHDVRVLDDLSTGNLENLAGVEGQIDFVEGSVADPAAVVQAIDGIEVVFHEAALASVQRSVDFPLDTHAACVTGTINLLDASRKAGVRRVVYAASSSAYGNQPEMPKREDQLPLVLSPYAAAKMAGELYLQSFAATYGLETVRLRYFNVFGPRQDPNSQYSAVIPRFIAALLDGRRPTIYGDGLQSRDFTFIDNVVHANILAANTPGISGRVYNAACGESLNLFDLLKFTCSELDVPYDPIFEAERPGDVKHSWADISAARDELGYEVQVELYDGLRQTIAYYRDQHADRQALEC